MRPLDIREYKQNLRNAVKQQRKDLTTEEKLILDNGVLSNVRKMREYQGCSTVFVYVSTPIEVDTRNIIAMAWSDNKRVAVPRCIPETRQMTFHYINSFDDLTPGTFSVLEPSADAPLAENFDKSIMLVPALMIDKYGYRLGYGKGYYDRYISKYCGLTVGLCYINNIKNRLYHGRFDKKLDYIITEKYIKRTLA